MSKIFNYAQDFLDDGGTDLGYTHQALPHFDDMSYVLRYSVKVWEYKGMSQKQYYSGGW